MADKKETGKLMLRQIVHAIRPQVIRSRMSVRGLSSQPAPKEVSGIADPPTVSVIGAPMCYGQPLNGPELAPSLLREHGLRSVITKLGWRMEDRGDVSIPRPSRHDPTSPVGGINAYAVCKGNGDVAAMTQKAAQDGHFSLVLGGDHSVAMGSIGGLLRERPNLGIVWVDAHADINTTETSTSGNIHGMPVAFLLRLLEVSEVPGCEWMADVPKLLPENLVYVALRDVDDGEKRLLRKLGIKSYTMHDVDRYGIGKVMEMALDKLAGTEERPLHMSFDIDATDPSIAPATGTAVVGGLNYRESHYVCEAMAETGLMGSMDMVEVNASLGKTKEDGDRTVTEALRLVGSALGQSIID